MSITTPECILVYGTLREEFIHENDYCRTFNYNTVSVPAIMPKAKLYYDFYYPYVITTDNDDDYIEGLLVFPKNIYTKLKESDYIENEGTLYKRVINKVIIKSTGEIFDAYVYIIEKYNLTEEKTKELLQRTKYDYRLTMSFIKHKIL